MLNFEGIFALLHPDVNFSCDNINCHFLSITTNTVTDLPSVRTSPLQYSNTSNDVPSLSLSEVNVQSIFHSWLPTKL